MFQIRVERRHEMEEKEEERVQVDPQTAAFLTGNPQVRISTGKLRFYRPDRCSLVGRNVDVHGIPLERSTLVCIVTVPSHMSPIELLEFLASFRSDILVVRILKDLERNNCMALLQFVTQERADQFFQDYNGTYFNSIEQQRCKIVFVKSIEFDAVEEFGEDGLEQKEEPSAGEKQQQQQQQQQQRERASSSTCSSAPLSVQQPTVAKNLFPLPPPGMTEIPTCAVCLDRLDASASGILTTLCNHTFHCDCLFRWEGSSCPVCRYSHGDIGSSCEVCHTSEHLWICLICGHVGCGRYSGEHAKQHYQETLHTYSLELETQRVWDYAGDGYVHRLILNKRDGKFVEVPHPNSLSGERSQFPPMTSAEEEEDEHRKLEKLAVEYNFLLKRIYSQLEEQRVFFERRLATMAANAENSNGNNSSSCEQCKTLSLVEQERNKLKKTNETLIAKSSKLEEELSFVRELNKSLLENQKQLKERVHVLENHCDSIEIETTQRVAELEAQVRDLMFYLDTQTRVEKSVHKSDIQGGTIEIVQRLAGSSASSSATSTSASTSSRAGSARRGKSRKR